MAFTAQTSVINNSTTNASVDIAVSPDSAIITATNLSPGSAVTGATTVSNTGTIDEYYFVSADWTEANFSVSRTTILANTMNVSVVVSPDTGLYTGTLAGLIDQPSGGRQITTADRDEDLLITVALPTDAGNLVMGVDANIDFVFVATSTNTP